jgi:hypothetical protein
MDDLRNPSFHESSHFVERSVFDRDFDSQEISYFDNPGDIGISDDVRQSLAPLEKGTDLHLVQNDDVRDTGLPLDKSADLYLEHKRLNDDVMQSRDTITPLTDLYLEQKRRDLALQLEKSGRRGSFQDNHRGILAQHKDHRSDVGQEDMNRLATDSLAPRHLLMGDAIDSNTRNENMYAGEGRRASGRGGSYQEQVQKEAMARRDSYQEKIRELNPEVQRDRRDSYQEQIRELNPEVQRDRRDSYQEKIRESHPEVQRDLYQEKIPTLGPDERDQLPLGMFSRNQIQNSFQDHIPIMNEKIGPIVSPTRKPPTGYGFFAYWDIKGRFHQGFRDENRIRGGYFDDQCNFHFTPFGDEVYVEDSMMIREVEASTAASSQVSRDLRDIREQR